MMIVSNHFSILRLIVIMGPAIKDKEPVPMAFFNKRSESIIVPAATKFTWKLHLSGGIERPRDIVIAFQTGRGEDQTTNNASFDVAGLMHMFY